MISVNEAQQRIVSGLLPLPIIQLPLEFALGHTLAKTILSNQNLPSFDNSSVDGFAIKAADIVAAMNDKPVVLQVVADIPAGSMSEIEITSGHSARIMTGAPVPAGADAVVMIEDTDAFYMSSGNLAPDEVSIFTSIQKGQNIRRRGTDLTIGQEILKVGTTLRPQDIGLLAMLGIPSVPVRRKPRIAILSSGDELVPVSAPLEPGKIHDSNTYMLTALAQNAGCEVVHIGVAADNYDSVQELMMRAAGSKPDVIISSAGVSTGAFDFVKEVVTNAGSLTFWKVDMRPGKPLAFGSYREIPFFGLPGNPVSAFVSFLVFVHPALDALNGVKATVNSRIKVTLNEGIESDGRESYLRAIVDSREGKLHASLTGHQGSGNLFSLVQANALLIIPSGVKSCPPGSEVDAWLLENKNG
jgi:molybdopterin molybdotransferase